MKRFLNPRKAANGRLIAKILVILIIFVLSCGYAQARSRDILKVGSDLMIEEGMNIRDAVVIMGDVTVDGTVERDVVVIGGSIILTNKAFVGRNVVAISGMIERSEEAEVGGDLTEVNIPGLYTLVSLFSNDNRSGSFFGFSVWPIICFLGYLTLALLITTLFPGSTQAISDKIAAGPIKSGLSGLLAMLLIVPLAILLAISIIGLLLIPVEMTAVSTALLIGYIAAAQLIGKKMTAALKRPQATPLWGTFWGVIILGGISLIPFLGWAINALAAIVGFGGTWLSLMSTRNSRAAQSYAEQQDLPF